MWLTEKVTKLRDKTTCNVVNNLKVSPILFPFSFLGSKSMIIRFVYFGTNITRK